jgi:predicted  nucleic acid-binding Zn-ribbon protein
MTNPKIKQQEAAVEMMRLLVSAKRARPEKLEAAINELNRLKSESSSEIHTAVRPKPEIRQSTRTAAITKDANSSVFEIKQGALSQEVTLLRRDQSELSNILHKISPDQECPELVDKILNLHYQIEEIWDQKKFLGRNQHEGPADPAHDQQLVERSVIAVESKAELSVKIQQLREKRSKLKKKLENPKASMESRSKWEIEMAQVDAGIEEASTKRALL